MPRSSFHPSLTNSQRAPAFSIVGLVVRIRTSKSPDLTWNQPEILLWGQAEITTGLICVCVPPLAALTHPRLNRAKRAYKNVHSSGGRQSDTASRRARPLFLEERDLLSPSDLELQYNAVAFPPALVTTGISGGPDVHESGYEKARVGPSEMTTRTGGCGGVGGMARIDVTTTVEQYCR